MTLPIAPPSIETAEGAPRFGTYQGSVNEVDLSRLEGAYRPALSGRLTKHKRWLYSFVATPEVIGLFAVVDLTYTANAFALVADLRQRRILVDDGFLGPPGPLVGVNNRPGEGLAVHFRTLGASFSAKRGQGAPRYQTSVELSQWLPFPRQKLSLQGELLAAGGAPALTVIAPVQEGGVVNVTQKWGGLLAFGSLEAGGQRYVLDGGVGGLDYTHGYLARHTAWRWAFGNGRLEDGTPLGLNLVEGFNESSGTNENALWVGRRLIPLGRARFEYNPRDVLDEWRVTTEDKVVKLRFRPIGVHREERDLKLVRSYFVQPVGTFEGTLMVDGTEHRIQSLPGVTEDQDVLW